MITLFFFFIPTTIYIKNQKNMLNDELNTWNFDDDVYYTSLYEQRNAMYSEAPHTSFDDNELEVFFDNETAPTPQIDRIVGVCNDKPLEY